jgi:hypothetical protein
MSVKHPRWSIDKPSVFSAYSVDSGNLWNIVPGC